jgi:hypothetical protein
LLIDFVYDVGGFIKLVAIGVDSKAGLPVVQVANNLINIFDVGIVLHVLSMVGDKHLFAVFHPIPDFPDCLAPLHFLPLS